MLQVSRFGNPWQLFGTFVMSRFFAAIASNPSLCYQVVAAGSLRNSKKLQRRRRRVSKQHPKITPIRIASMLGCFFIVFFCQNSFQFLLGADVIQNMFIMKLLTQVQNDPNSERKRLSGGQFFRFLKVPTPSTVQSFYSVLSTCTSN